MRTDSAGGTVTHTTMSHHEHRLYSQICRSISLTTHHSHFPAMLFDPTRTLTKVAGRLARIPAYNAESRRRVQLTQREASAHTNLLYRIVRHTQARVIPLSNCSHRCSFPLAIDRVAIDRPCTVHCLNHVGAGRHTPFHVDCRTFPRRLPLCEPYSMV